MSVFAFGDYVTYRGRELTWQVTEVGDNLVYLISGQSGRRACATPNELEPYRKAETMTDHIETLTDEDTGTYHVRTSSGTVYLIDMDERQLIRLRGQEGHSPDFESTHLRRDGEPLALKEVGHCRVGQRATFFISGLSPVDTYRNSTPVLSIVKAEA